MNDDTPVIHATKSGDTAEQPDAAPEAAPKKKSRAARKTAAINAMQKRVGHEFADRSLMVTAFTHVSALAPSRHRRESYQRLEFLGDHVLGLVVSDMLYRAFPNADEGELSKRLSDLVRKESCAQVAEELGLGEDIKLGAVGNAMANARLRKAVLGDICEAVIGAIYVDAGYQAAQQFVEKHWTKRMTKHRRPVRDAKTGLQEWAQSKGLPTPVYREIDRTGPHHDPVFRVSVTLPGLEPAEGTGSSKRQAEKSAALAMIEREKVGGKYEV